MSTKCQKYFSIINSYGTSHLSVQWTFTVNLNKDTNKGFKFNLYRPDLKPLYLQDLRLNDYWPYVRSFNNKTVTCVDNDFSPISIFFTHTPDSAFPFPSLQLPSLMIRWSAAEESVWPSRWPKTASTGTLIAPPLASWRWISLNCWETANTKWGKQVSKATTKCKWIVESIHCLYCMCLLM